MKRLHVLFMCDRFSPHYSHIQLHIDTTLLCCICRFQYKTSNINSAVRSNMLCCCLKEWSSKVPKYHYFLVASPTPWSQGFPGGASKPESSRSKPAAMLSSDAVPKTLPRPQPFPWIITAKCSSFFMWSDSRLNKYGEDPSTDLANPIWLPDLFLGMSHLFQISAWPNLG